EIAAGQNVLINGAAGGVGTFAVQIAKLYGATVTAVCSGRNVEMVRSLGADEVVDYTAEDIAEMTGRFDLILDNAGSQPPSALARMLTPNGRLVVVTGPKKGKLFGPLAHIIRSKARFTFDSREVRSVGAQSKREDLAQIGAWVADGSITPAIHRTYSLDETPEAVELLAGGHAPAKLVINP
ncbi:MAG TPA: NAD(P)-dependent alcohol dehydrogenase, partial [Candidatus Sulfomarinibacteraceae bacterium]|nr:NAD(P)-dependent alcohol dehydrogenase [Candidatus Sulfomarinibacteraceae bacterium]